MLVDESGSLVFGVGSTTVFFNVRLRDYDQKVDVYIKIEDFNNMPIIRNGKTFLNLSGSEDPLKYYNARIAKIMFNLYEQASRYVNWETGKFKKHLYYFDKYILRKGLRK